MKALATRLLIFLVILIVNSNTIYAQEWLDVLDKVLTKTVEIAEYAEMASVILASDDELEYMLHIRTKAQMEIEHNLYTSDVLNSIGEKLVAQCDRKYLPKGLTYKFYIIDSNGFNAFAIPGGGIYITRGLYNAFNEDELAFVLGHEIGHICERHSVRQIKSSTEFIALKTIALKLIKKESDFESQLDVLSTAAYSAVQSGFSREWETTVDKYGVKLAANAGFDPYGSVGAMSKIAAATNASSFWGANCFLWNTHPNVYKRIEVLKEEAALYGNFSNSKISPKPPMAALPSQKLAEYNLGLLSNKYHVKEESEIKAGQVKLTKDKIFQITGGEKKNRVYYSQLKKYYGNSFRMTNFYSASNGWGGGGVVTRKGVPMIFNNEAPLPWGYVVEFEYEIPKSLINCAFTYSSRENPFQSSPNFENFSGIKRTFGIGEPVNVAVKIQRAYNSKKLIELEISKKPSGQVIKSANISTDKDINCFTFSDLEKGNYTLKLKLKSTNDSKLESTYTEDFQIHTEEQTTLEESAWGVKKESQYTSEPSSPLSASSSTAKDKSSFHIGKTINSITNSKEPTLPSFDLNKLERKFKFEEINVTKVDSSLIRWLMDDKKETIQHIASELGTTKDKLRFVPYRTIKGNTIYATGYVSFSHLYATKGIRKVTKKKLDNIYYHSSPLIRTPRGCSNFSTGIAFHFKAYNKPQIAEGFEIYYMKINKTTKAYYKDEIKTIFSCNWVKDFDINGFDFNEFNGIKRSFGQDEDILLVLGCTSNSSGDWNMEIFEKNTGNIVLEKNGQIFRGKNLKTVDIESLTLPKGIYLCNFSIKSSDYETKSKQETFEIY